MIQLFDKVAFFMDMVNLQVNRANISKMVVNNSYDAVYELYVFGGVLRGVKQKPLKTSKALWFGEGTTLEDIKAYDEHLHGKIDWFLKKYPDVKLPPKSLVL